MNEKLEPPGGLLTTAETARALSVSARYLEILRVRGGGPVFLSLGRSVRYRLVDVEAWLSTRTRRSTSEQVAAAAAVAQ